MFHCYLCGLYRSILKFSVRVLIADGLNADDGVVPAGLAKASSGAFSGVGFADVTLKTYPQ